MSYRYTKKFDERAAAVPPIPTELLAKTERFTDLSQDDDEAFQAALKSACAALRSVSPKTRDEDREPVETVNYVTRISRGCLVIQ